MYPGFFLRKAGEIAVRQCNRPNYVCAEISSFKCGLPSGTGRRFLSLGAVRKNEVKLPKGSKEPKMPPSSWRALGITAGVGAALWAWMIYAKHEKEEAIRKERSKQIGKAKIGGEWELTDHNGVPRTSKDFHGSWILLYFGFTHCPDICPDEIEKMLEVATLLEKKEDIKVQPLFITVDPERDNVEAVKRYCKEFSPKLLGLTGTNEQITKAAKAFRVYFSAAPAADEDNDYIVDHTIIIYLIDPEGKFVDYYGQNKTAVQMAEHIGSYIDRFKYLRW